MCLRFDEGFLRSLNYDLFVEVSKCTCITCNSFSVSKNQLKVSKVLSVLPPSLQDLLNKQRAAEIRLEAERRRLREALEAAEARATRVELGRRSLEGELQRLKLSLGDREVESQTSQERHDALLKQVRQAEQSTLCRLL